MPKILPVAVLVGLVAGLLVGGFHFVFSVPVIERAIALEEQQASDAAKAHGMAVEPEAPLVSLGVQRILAVPGFGLLGVVVGVVFAGGFSLLRRVTPQWPPLALAVTVGALGFWSLSLLPFIKYPLNPPGVGSEESLLFRQGFAELFRLLSALGVVGLLLGVRQVNLKTAVAAQRVKLYGLLLLAYGVFAAVIFQAIPGNPDPVPVPIDLLQLFRTLSIIGHFLLWSLLAGGVGLTILWRQRTTPEAKRAAAIAGDPATGPARR